MSRQSYIDFLDLLLAGAVTRLSAEQLDAARTFFLKSQQPDGGFAGREGDSDFYYTGFGVRGLVLVGGLSVAAKDGVAGFLAKQSELAETLIDFLSILYSARLVEQDALIQKLRPRIVETVNAHRAPDGGYTKNKGAVMGSTYHTFLAALICEMLEHPLPEPERAAAFLSARRRDDGGFADLAVMKRSGTNPTAAAAALLQMLQPDSEDTQQWKKGIVDCLLGLQSSAEGGFCANSLVPVADLLSTFTALLTLLQLGALPLHDVARIRSFIGSLAMPDGGFRAGIWDDVADVEYTFYGLGALAIVTNED